jgi:hypothetical protein
MEFPQSELRRMNDKHPFEIAMETSAIPPSEIEEDEPTSNPFEIAMETSAIPPSEIEEDDSTSNPFENNNG